MYKIELAGKNNIPELINFFRNVYPVRNGLSNGVHRAGHIMTDREYLDWQYLNAPGNVCFPKYPNLILKNSGDIVGHLGMIPYSFNFPGKSANGAFLASLIVSKELRSRGAGVMLVREAEKYFDVLYTTGFSPPSAPVLKFCNWASPQNMARWVCDCGKTPDPADDGFVVLIRRFGDEWDQYWKKAGKYYGVTIDRSSNYLNWRFCDNPKIKYHIFGIDPNGTGGYMVLRMENGNEFQGMRIVDLVASDKAAGALLRFSASFAKGQKADFIDFFSFPGRYSTALQISGFYRYNPGMAEDPPIFILPTDRKKLTLNFSYKVVKGEPISPEDWFVVKSDGDRDRAY